MIRNFLYRVEQFIRENRARLMKAFLIASAALIAAALIYYGIEQLQRARYERRVDALDALYRDADARAKEAEARAANIQLAIEAKYVELSNLRARAESAETNLRNARRAVAPLKEAYEETRLTPIPDTPVSCADACAQLAAIGYPCQ